MALNVVPLLFVALPFVLAMDAMYDLAQDFMLPADRRGWGLTDDHAKSNRIRRAYLNHFNAILTRQKNAFAAWKADDASKTWRDSDKKERQTANTELEKARRSDNKQTIQDAEDKIERLNHPLRIQYGVGIPQFESSIAANLDLDAALNGVPTNVGVLSMVERLSEVEPAAKSAKAYFDNQNRAKVEADAARVTQAGSIAKKTSSSTKTSTSTKTSIIIFISITSTSIISISIINFSIISFSITWAKWW